MADPNFFAPSPGRRADLYGPKANNNQKRCHQMAQEYFRDGVKRARDRTQRYGQLEQDLVRGNLSDAPQAWKNAGILEAKYLRFLRTKESLANYIPIKTIGKGAFGEVKLVRKVQDRKVYALKRLVKTEMISRDQLPRVRAERDALAESDSEWVVKLYTTFQDDKSLFMVMEFLPGGDLMAMLIRHEIFSEDITRFYISELIMAIEFVHGLGFIHRDIKPDNVLLDRHGHVKLADFGLSTGFRKLHDNSYYQQLLNGQPSVPPVADRNRNRFSVNIDEISLTVSNRAQINEWRRSRRVLAYSAVGTPDYIAPEIVMRQAYSFDVDWWSLGTIVFECLVGWPPFAAEYPPDVYQKIVNWRYTLVFPDDIQLSYNAVHLIRSLIRDNTSRLGIEGSEEIKRHPFFAGVPFDQLHQFRAPFVPPLASDVDTSHFPVDELPQAEGARDGGGNNEAGNGDAMETQDDGPTPDMMLPFIGYTFKRFEKIYQ